MDQPPFLSLSPELILLVCETLQLTDLKQLRLSCKHISGITDSLVLQRLSISAADTSLEEAILYLQLLKESPARHITQEIVIRDLSSLSPAYVSRSDQLSSVLTSEEGIQEKIKETLDSLTSVRRVTWCPNVKESIWLQKTIWIVIRSFPALRHLSTRTEFLRIFPNFDALTYLDSISIDATYCSSTSWIYTSLSKLYASSSSLTSVSIWYGSGRRLFTKANSLNHIFSTCSKGASSSGLRHLSLHDCFISINKLTLPHLRQLTSLELLCENHRYSDWEATCDSHPRNIWSTFIGSGIRLEELVHNTTPPALIDYLSTYSGLKKLNLLVSPFRDRSSSDKTATRFFDTVLSRHLDTLKDLSLQAYYEGKWCYTMRNEVLITRCTKLNRLLISLISSRSDDEGQDGNVDRSGKTRNMVKRLLDTAIRLPLLSHLSLFPAYPESSRGDRCGTRAECHSSESEFEIAKKVKNYRPPISCRYIPVVEVCRKNFEVVRDPDGQLRYEAETEEVY